MKIDAKTLANRLQKHIAKEIETVEREKLDIIWKNVVDEGPHGYWKLTRSLIGSTEKMKKKFPLKETDGKQILEDNDKCIAFRELYETIYKPAETDSTFQNTANHVEAYYRFLRIIFAEVKQRDQDIEFDFQTTVTVENITSALKITKNTAPGADGIYYIHLKYLPVRATEYLASLYEMCIKCTYFRDKWKQGQTTLIPKPNKDLTEPKSYRPITLLRALGKSLERINRN